MLGRGVAGHHDVRRSVEVGTLHVATLSVLDVPPGLESSVFFRNFAQPGGDFVGEPDHWSGRLRDRLRGWMLYVRTISGYLCLLAGPHCGT